MKRKKSFAKDRTGTSEAAQTNQQPAGLTPQTKQIIIGLLSRAEVARQIGVCPHTVQRLTRRGLLPAIVFNRRLIRYRTEAVEAFIQSAAVK